MGKHLEDGQQPHALRHEEFYEAEEFFCQHDKTEGT
jgi:hypothetical protein